MEPQCSFCGTSTGPFIEVEGLFTVLMCAGCRAARAGPVLERAELVVRPDLREPWLQWGCPVTGCDHRVELPWALEGHTATEHPGWTATVEADGEQQWAGLWRVVFRQPGG